MTAEQHGELPQTDEGSWIYLSGSGGDGAGFSQGLVEQLVEACEVSGWATVTRSTEERIGRAADPGHFFESVRHAVEHADVVVALIGERSEISEAELALAYSHGRPVVGIQISGQGSIEAGMQTMLREYGRAHMVTCDSAEECAVGLREAFADPEFAQTIREAA